MAITPQDLLSHMAVPDKPGMYLLGCLERRVTVYSQQIRAFNLIYSLFELDLARKDTRIVVIGGGVAGLTLAAAATTKGCEVTLLEKESKPLHLFDGSTSRWIHPRIYDWPHLEANDSDAGLPLMNWRADLAGNVARGLQTAWQPFLYDEQYRHAVKTYYGCNDIEYFPEVNKDGWYLTWNSERRGAGHFDIVVWAIGFGLERTIAPLEMLSYWREDSHHQTPLNRSGLTSFLISGCGDGGLTDLLRLRLNNYKHDDTLQALINKADLDGVRDGLSAIEKYAQKFSDRDVQAEIYEVGYQRLPKSGVISWLQQNLRKDTIVTLNGPARSPFLASASTLNRYLAYCLMQVDKIDYWTGEIETIERQNQKYEITLKETPRKARQRKVFDKVIIRHGAESPLKAWTELWSKCEPLKNRNVLDQTRERLWDRGWWFDEGEIEDLADLNHRRSMAQLRRLIYKLLPEEASFDTFCHTFYPTVYGLYAQSSAEKQQRITALLQRNPQEEIFVRLKEIFRKKALATQLSEFRLVDIPATYSKQTDWSELISKIFRDTSNFEAFCADYFPQISQSFSGGITLNEKISLLTSLANKRLLYTFLKEAYPDEVELHEVPLILASDKRLALLEDKRLPVPTTRSLRIFLRNFFPKQPKQTQTKEINKLMKNDYINILLDIRRKYPVDFTEHCKILVLAESVSRIELRRSIDKHCPTNRAFVNFCAKYFPQISMRFAVGMDKMTRQTLLLQLVAAEMISVRLSEAFPPKSTSRKKKRSLV